MQKSESFFFLSIFFKCLVFACHDIFSDVLHIYPEILFFYTDQLMSKIMLDMKFLHSFFLQVIILKEIPKLNLVIWLYSRVIPLCLCQVLVAMVMRRRS